MKALVIAHPINRNVGFKICINFSPNKETLLNTIDYAMHLKWNNRFFRD